MNTPEKMPVSKQLTFARPLPTVSASDLAPCGFGHMSDSDYYSVFNGPKVLNASRLKRYVDSAWQGYFEDNQPEEINEAMRFGSLVHALALTPDDLSAFKIEDKRVALKKDGTPYANGQQDADQKAEWETLASQGISVLSTEQYAKAKALAAAATTAIAERYPYSKWNTEVTLWYTSGEGDDYTCKGKADAVDLENHLMLDIKTTGADIADPRALEREFYKYGYDVQVYLYSRLYEATVGHHLNGFDIVWVSKADPCQARIMTIDRPTIYNMMERFNRAWDNILLADAANYVPSTTLEPFALA